MDIQNFIVTPDLYAKKSNRLANYFIDKLVFYAIIFGLSFIIGTLFYMLSNDITVIDDFYSDLDNMDPLMDKLLTAIIFIVFYMITEILLKGKTIGKYITKTKVVMEDGSNPKPSDIVLRSLCRLIPFDAFSFLGSEGRGWHDSVSNTYVVDEKRFNAKLEAINNLEQIGQSVEK